MCMSFLVTREVFQGRYSFTLMADLGHDCEQFRQKDWTWGNNCNWALSPVKRCSHYLGQEIVCVLQDESTFTKAPILSFGQLIISPHRLLSLLLSSDSSLLLSIYTHMIRHLIIIQIKQKGHLLIFNISNQTLIQTWVLPHKIVQRVRI